MNDYRARSFAGTQYTRCNRILVDNPLGGVARMRFAQEDVVSSDGQFVASKQAEELSTTFSPDATIAMRDPDTGELTGESVTHEQLRVILFSAYMEALAALEARQAAKIAADVARAAAAAQAEAEAIERRDEANAAQHARALEMARGDA